MDDEEDCTPQRIFPRNPATIIDKDDDVLVTSESKRGAETRNEVEDEEMEKPAKSEEAEVGEYVEHFFTYYIITLLQSAFGMSGKLPSMPFSNQRPQSSTLMADECMCSHALQIIVEEKANSGDPSTASSIKVMHH